jgi:hypothetical protein
MRANFPARLHVLLARESNLGVVFRRGPSKQVCTFLWDRSTDSFTLGQWLRGRIYERRADLSPNGRFLIYFAMNGKWQSETGGSWTAISRTPWLKAIALYAKGDCWEGGGLFLSNRNYWLNDRYFSPGRVIAETPELCRNTEHAPTEKFGAEDTGVYYPRLLRDGWLLIGHRENAKWNSVTVFEKALNDQWTLRKIAHEQVGAPPGKGCYWDEHELRSEVFGVLSLPTWEWAEVDNGKLLWAEHGRLYRASANNSEPLRHAKVLHDFNSYRFKALQAPYEYGS